MRRSLIAGLVLAVFAALIIGLGNLFGFDLDHVALLGAAIGGALGLVPHRFSWGRIAGFLLGFVAAWIGFALRAAVLPDSSWGRAAAAFLVVALCTVVCSLSSGRLPLWSALLGAAAIVGAYEEIYTNAPSQFLSQSPEPATTVLLAVALGYLATSVVHDLMTDSADQRAVDRGAGEGGPAESRRSRGTAVQPEHAREPQSAAHTDTTTDGTARLDGLLAGENK